MDLFVGAIDSKIQPLEEYQKLVKIRTSKTKSDSVSSKINSNDSKISKKHKSPPNLVKPSHDTEPDKPVATPTEKGGEKEKDQVPFLNSLVDSCTDLVRITNRILKDGDRNILSESPKEGKASEIYTTCQNSIQIIQNIVKKVAPYHVYNHGMSSMDVLLDELKSFFKRDQKWNSRTSLDLEFKKFMSDSVSSQRQSKSEKAVSQKSNGSPSVSSQESNKSENAVSQDSEGDNSESNESLAKEDSEAKKTNDLTDQTSVQDKNSILSEHSLKIDLKKYNLPPRPQDKWKCSIDNFTTMPHINRKKKKYNKMMPQIEYNKKDREQRLFKNGFVPQIYPKIDQLRMVRNSEGVNRHLYMQELNSLEWSEEKLDSTHKGYNILGGEWNLLKPSEPLELGESKYKMVLTQKDLDEMIESIRKSTILSIDVEHWSRNTYRGIVCLIQMSTPDQNYIVDPFDIFTHLHSLNRVTTDPRILKVMHGSDNDIVWLQRDFGVYIVNMFDTRQAARVLNLQGDSLLKLIDKYFNVKMNKKYQLADWSKRPLDKNMLNYACSDSNYLIPLYVKMKNEILSSSDGKVNMVRVMNYSRDICLTQYVDKGIDVVRKFNRVTNKNKMDRKSMSFVQYNFLLNMLEFRNYAARKLDVSEQMVIKDFQLSLLIKKLPMANLFTKIMYDVLHLVHHEIPNLLKIKNTLCLLHQKLNDSPLRLKEPQSIMHILDFLKNNDKESQLDEFQKIKNTKCIDNTLKVYNKFVANGLFNNTSTMQIDMNQEKHQSKVEEILEKRSLVEEADMVEEWKRKRFNIQVNNKPQKAMCRTKSFGEEWSRKIENGEYGVWRAMPDVYPM